MKITLAQALKEKNRLAGEIQRLWAMVAKENAKREDFKRVINVETTYQTLQHYTEKLVELKTKIGLANAGNLENIYRMEECKNQLLKLSNIGTDESTDVVRLSDTQYKELKRTVIFDAAQLWQMREQLQQECNRLQDAMDTYNATTRINYETPLGHK